METNPPTHNVKARDPVGSKNILLRQSTSLGPKVWVTQQPVTLIISHWELYDSKLTNPHCFHLWTVILCELRILYVNCNILCSCSFNVGRQRRWKDFFLSIHLFSIMLTFPCLHIANISLVLLNAAAALLNFSNFLNKSKPVTHLVISSIDFYQKVGIKVDL